MSAKLTATVTSEEIQRVVFSMPNNKSSGPDGFNKEFFTATWDILGRDFVTGIQSYFCYGLMPLGINATALVLIPKKKDALSVSDYRPIACCNFIYKTISKIIANRLSHILPQAVEQNQSAFIKGRLLLENVLLATELVKDYHKQKIAPRACLKLDISKAFDSIRWDFIVMTLKAMGIPEMFIQWIYGCISTASFSVCVNGELEGFFQSSRGIRQGCAMSPYIYDIVNNVLSLLLNRAAEVGKYGYHPLCDEVNITHLSFADDILVFFDGSDKSLKEIMRVLRVYEAASGLVINMSKSALYKGGKTLPPLSTLANSMTFRIECLPIRYLGLPLTTKRMTRTDYEPLVDRIRSRMLSWKNKTLSYAGRLQLIKSVISSIANFWCSAFKLPQSCLDEIESMCCAFLWSGSPNNTSKAKVAWEVVTRPKAEGGLGLRKLSDTSTVFSLNLIWRLLSRAGSLWVAWVYRVLLKDQSFWEVKQTIKGSWIWRKLLKLRTVARNFVRIDIRNGLATDFWHDPWLATGIIKDITGNDGSRNLGLPWNSKVADACVEGQWTFRRCRNSAFRSVIEAIMQVRPPSEFLGQDVPMWRTMGSEFKPVFSAKSTWHQIRTPHQRTPWSKVIWFPFSIPRFSFITWLAMLDKLQTGNHVAKWSTPKPCPLCGERNETRDHLFFACPFVFTIWSMICSKLLGRVPTPDWTYSINSLISNRKSRLDNILYRMAFQTTVYLVWRERNSRHHSTRRLSPHRLTQLIKKTIGDRIRSKQDGDAEEKLALSARWQLVSS